ncbi:MAG: FAD-dependent oxidoreductase [Bradyrhizobium sp.]|jgi:2,4-dienoyl-CoA reductase (NADPH2)|uniref:NADPH-dependent 2,4-dienoyl-CoA reductase n=1 Tax=Bradyrhizobium TaxID=374 RepID=UPI000410FE21|nr:MULTISPECIES: NADPH-dependent 2,4-dienoyl-CoA reductase [Bradyrhizobium]MBJ7402071.1 FAD-dependent oxidoreductase [Bradyrhizobium sp.]
MNTTASSTYARLLSPLKVGRHEMRNRIIMGSMHTKLECKPDPIAAQLAFYVERARGGVALIVTGGFSPNAEGVLDAQGPRLDDPEEAQALRPICDAVHHEGALICAQLLHAGRYAKIACCVAPSPIRAPINRHIPREMLDSDIRRTISQFAEAAANAQAAGFDGVEIMGSEGYLINEFTVTHTNKREDAWGGSAENRHRFPVEVVRAVRQRCGPDLLIIYRISAADLIEDGAPADEIAALARKVEAAGADIINTGIGWHEARVPTIAYPVPRGAWRKAAARVRAAVSIPVVASNRISTAEMAEDILASGDADLISMARPMLADPFFANKVRDGRVDEINTCIACNQACLDYIFSGRAVSCLVNPRAGRESELRDTPAEVRKKIAVVGGGAAGMATATEAARRGHFVSLFEVSQTLGGQLTLARAVPGKNEFDDTLRYFRRQVDKHGVNLHLGRRASPEDLSGYDHVVIATGVSPRIPDLPGVDHPKVATYAEILSGTRVAGKTVAIVGAGGIGFDVAEFLVTPTAEANGSEAFFDTWGVDGNFSAPGALKADPQAPVDGTRKVVMLQRKTTKPGDGLGVSTGWILRNALRKYGVEMLGGVSYERINDEGLHIKIAGRRQVIAADTIVLCTGQESERALHAALIERGIPATVVGGAKEATELDALRAIDEGIRLAQSL